MPIRSFTSFSLQDGVVLCSIAALATLARTYLRYRRFLAVTPPGPKPIPYLGNIYDIPKERDWLAYSEWARQYSSDLISIRAFGQLTIVVNSAQAARELLGKRSSNYSDKPRLAMLELIEWNWNTAFIGYNDHWRDRRRLLHRALNVNAVSTYYPIQARFARKFLTDLYHEPKLFTEHVEHLSAGLSLYVAYALEDNQLANVARDAFIMLSQSIFPGATLVNTFPMLKYLPEWFPGTGYHAFARKSRELTRKMRFDPLTRVREQVADGTARPSLTLSMLRSSETKTEEELVAIADVAAIIFGAGSDSSTAALRAITQALVLYPAVLQRAQAEIDAVVGRDRLPEHADRSAMPYVDAVCREVLRWHTITPLGAPRAAIDDDEYDGWLIPAGSTIIWNAWAISHDPETYQNPHDFVPERWLDEDGQLTGEEEDTAFGYGRRGCVGVHFAKTSLWVSVASMLSVFKFSKAKDENGDDIEISLDRTAGLVSHPVPFQCSIQPRDEKAVELIESLSLSFGSEET